MSKEHLPNLLIIGAMKSGTTSLHNYLNLHPDIFMSEPKELHYYSDQYFETWDREWYKSLFITDCKVRGTSPQSYTKAHNMYYKNIPERIYRDTPDVKMIYVVRDPIKRYESHILESYHCDPVQDVKYNKESGNYWKTSLYYYQISQFLEYFKKEQIHVLSLEELQANVLGEMNKIFSFLEVSEVSDPEMFNFVSNTADTKGIPRVIQDNLLYRAGLKLDKGLTKRIGSNLSKRFFKNQLKKPTLTKGEKEDLKNKLKEDINKFRILTGKSFEEWSI